MKINKIKIKNLVNSDNYFSKKENKLLFLIIILAVLPPTVSGMQNMNLWDKLIVTIENPLANIMFFLGIIIIILNVKKRICYNEMFYFRFNNQKELLINGIRTVAIAVSIYYTIFILISLAASSFLCLGNYELSVYEKYSVAMPVYILFKYIKNEIIYVIISTIIFILSNLIIKKYLKYILVLLLLVFFFLPYENWHISHFYQIPIFFQAYLLNTNFISFYNEIIVLLIYIFLLLALSKLIFNYSIKRKNNLE